MLPGGETLGGVPCTNVVLALWLCCEDWLSCNRHVLIEPSTWCLARSFSFIERRSSVTALGGCVEELVDVGWSVECEGATLSLC